jgi:PIN domain nuclease of toxin-antitoxin system
MATVLVGSCSLLLAVDTPEKLGAEAREAIGSEENRVLVSAGTLWELSIKAGLGKLELPEGFFEELAELGYETLGIEDRHLTEYRKLPLHQSEPVWERFARRVLDTERISLAVSGSSAKSDRFWTSGMSHRRRLRPVGTPTRRHSEPDAPPASGSRSMSGETPDLHERLRTFQILETSASLPPSAKPYKFTSAIASEDLYGLKIWRLEKKSGTTKKTPSTRVRNPPQRPAPLPHSKTQNAFRQTSPSLPALRQTIQVYLRDRVRRLVWFENLETRKKSGTTNKTLSTRARNPPPRPALLPRSKTRNEFRQPSASLPALRQTIQVYLRDRVRRLVWFETLEARKKIREHPIERPTRDNEIPHRAQLHSP